MKDSIPPAVSFRDPQNGDRVNGNREVSINATDNVAVTRVAFFADNQLVASWSRPPYTLKWNASKLKKGAHTLTCTAYDAAGNTASSSITVYR